MILRYLNTVNMAIWKMFRCSSSLNGQGEHLLTASIVDFPQLESIVKLSQKNNYLYNPWAKPRHLPVRLFSPQHISESHRFGHNSTVGELSRRKFWPHPMANIAMDSNRKHSLVYQDLKSLFTNVRSEWQSDQVRCFIWPNFEPKQSPSIKPNWSQLRLKTWKNVDLKCQKPVHI